MDLRRGINIATQAVVEELKKQSTSISTTEEIAQVFFAAQKYFFSAVASDDAVRVAVCGFVCVLFVPFCAV